MTRCDFRSMSECRCPANMCAAQPAELPPHVSFSWRQHLAVIAAGLSAFAFVFIAMSAWNEQMRTQAQISQEVTYYGNR